MLFDTFDMLILEIKKILKKHYFKIFSIKKYFHENTLHCITKHKRKIIETALYILKIVKLFVGLIQIISKHA
jgi:hypothetical protein